MLDAILYALPFLGRGFLTTLAVSGLVVSLSLAAGVALGLALVYGPALIRWPIRIFSDLIRGIPILVLLFFVYYGLPALQVNLSAFWAAVMGLTIFKTAQVVENVRGAMQSVPRGQMDAGKAVGMTFAQRLLHVIAPQAVRRFLPPWLNGVTDAVKGSALVSLLGVLDLMLAIQQVIGRTYEPLPLYVLGAAIYFALNYSLSLASRMVERRFAYIKE